MPTYHYICDCGYEIELIEMMSEPHVHECPKCGVQLRQVYYPFQLHRGDLDSHYDPTLEGEFGSKHARTEAAKRAGLVETGSNEEPLLKARREVSYLRGKHGEAPGVEGEVKRVRSDAAKDIRAAKAAKVASASVDTAAKAAYDFLDKEQNR